MKLFCILKHIGYKGGLLKNFGYLVFFLLVNVVNFNLYAQNDPAIDSAMKETQDLLKNKSQRDELMKKDSKAREADNRVNAVTGGDAAQSQKLYDISSDIMPALMEAVGNDPTKAMELLQKAQNDPESFYKSLPKEIQNKIRGVASDIESKKATKNKP